MDRIQVCCIQSSSFKNGSIFVKMKNWINQNADSITWKKVDEKIDNGRGGTDIQHCVGSHDEIIICRMLRVVFR